MIIVHQDILSGESGGFLKMEIYIYIYSVIRWKLKLGKAVLIDEFRWRILLYSPSRQMTFNMLYYKIACKKSSDETENIIIFFAEINLS